MTERKYAIYDSETSGPRPRYDQIFQLAGILTDDSFAQVDQLNIRARRLPYVLPGPKALEVTNIDPYSLDSPEHYSPYEFAVEVHETFQRWAPAVFLGYNSIDFDEEIVRQMFWSNLLHPYITNTKGSMRADLLIMMRAYSACQPGAFVIPKNDEGKDSFRLEHIAPANGFENMQAHDALGDIYATAFMAKVCQQASPELWEHLLKLCQPRGCDEILSAPTCKLVTHFGVSETHLVTRLASNPTNPKQVCVFDLSVDPTPYLNLSARQIAERMRTDFRILRTVKTNSQPVLFHEGDKLAPEVTAEVTSGESNARLMAINDHPTFKIRVAEALSIRASEFEAAPHLEAKIYDGFPSRDDERLMREFHEAASWPQRKDIVARLQDSRMKQLGVRILMSEAPQVFDPAYRDKVKRGMLENRLMPPAEADLPWETFASARAGLAQVDDPELRARIETWLDEQEAAAQAVLAA
ncbi:hypothetical protein CKO28_00320 [Rhodovibrio sodomensis]|uniref:Exodeoxyribonuclease I n=1 Tax=Rhodovibrio sodomensis TaxID=1088 RepID=A0ABS1D8Z0_9PROT|nr:exonuclease domain-containing protein [Rhodovibrio sodomensis]MBK1666484.1 hypothetical protein [Rhodovibrio sodomensis]